MKKITGLFCVLLLIATKNIFAYQVCVDKYGTLTCSEGTIENVSYMGFVKTDGTTVSRRFDVLGDVSLNHSNLNKVHIKGKSQILKTNMTGPIDLTGSIEANDITMVGETHIIGEIQAKNASFSEKVKVTGKIECAFCLFKDKAHFIGEATIDNSEFLLPLTINIQTASFSHSKIGDVTVNYEHKNQEQVIELKNQSIAHDITFENQHGTVILSGNSKITGVVSGGKIITN